MEDTADVNWLYFLRGGSKEQAKEMISRLPVCQRNDDYYNVSHKKRGIALIFNHEYFDDFEMKPRDGTNRDTECLQKTLDKLNFDVRVYTDLKFGELYTTLKKAATENHTDHDCLFVCVMSHGDEGKIQSKDHPYSPDTLWSTFSGDACPGLVGKPKLFFIQACRGAKVDDGVNARDPNIRTDSYEGHQDTFKIPAMADILVMYSTYEGYFSWRNPTEGSWFIQALCTELEARSDYTDLMTILTFVNRRVALFNQSNVPSNKNMHKKKQVCTIVSMLTKLFVLPPKSETAQIADGKKSNVKTLN